MGGSESGPPHRFREISPRHPSHEFGALLGGAATLRFRRLHALVCARAGGRAACLPVGFLDNFHYVVGEVPGACNLAHPGGSKEDCVRDRRTFLRTALLSALALALPLGGIWRGLRIERRGKVFLVDGWVLTADDVRALRDHVL